MAETEASKGQTYTRITIPTLKRLFAAFRRYRIHVFLLMVLGFLSGLLEGIGISVVIPLFALIAGEQVEGLNAISNAILRVFDYLPFSYSVQSLLLLIVFFFALRAVVVVLFNWMRMRISASYMVRTMNDVLDKLLHAEWGYLLKQRMGNTEAMFLRDVRQTSGLLQSVSQFVLVATNLTMYVVFALYISPTITALTAFAGATLLLILQPVRTNIRKLAEHYAGTEKNIAHFLSEHMLGMKTVKASGAQKNVFQKGEAYFDTYKKYLVKNTFVQSAGTALIQPLALVFIAMLFMFTDTTRLAELGSFLALVYLIQKIFIYVEALQSTLHSIYDNIPYALSILRFRDALLGREERDRGTRHFSFADALTFENVKFSYEESAPVLSGIGFTIKKGESIGLVGPSGAGKTSIADLILRLFVPDGGKITLDGVDSADVQLSEWRRRIAYVSQDMFLLSDTIRNNIRFYDESISDAMVEQAVEMSNCREFISKLPRGLDTHVGERGMQLSVGQRQRIVLARALARQPEVLILDEATSALDNESERLVHQSIQAIHGTVTMLIIAHRLSTVMDMDHIIVLKDGAIIEEGDPRHLLDDPSSYFYKMAHMKDVIDAGAV